MKKFALSIMTIGAMFFGTQNIQAQVEEEIEVETEMEVAQEEFASVDVAELPQAVKDALATDYNGAVASEAWMKSKDDKKVYKLKLDVKGETKKVYIDQDGKWLEKEDKGQTEK
ncbi:hypothetical protein [Christiangramia echinicola]|uniref:Beta-lactamase-inhibitor-like, PepSY-like n=1 Tax=Christiangramia echinicola TaxID=279359 RepID=A0A1H1NJ90_9FLAO|nr:hypothetical protein [Christiangramia echinicola]SDR98775.1 hypothetical protein SAMN04488552_1737 [Christiangramia echinicola]